MISAARRSNIDGRSRKSNREWRVPSGSNPLRVVFYCRVSTDDQRDAGTVENQLSYLRLKYAVDFGPHAIKPMAFISDFVDDGISGTLPLHEREAGRALLEGARRGDFDAVIVYKLDRLGRTARVIVDAADELAKYDIALVSATEPIDTAPNADPFMQAVGRFIFSLLASLAEFDRATMLGRTSMGVRRLANQGKFISGPIPFGFAIGADGFLQPSEQLVDPLGSTEAELVVDIFRRVADGQSSQKVATWLNRIGVPATKRYWKKELQRAVHAPAGALGWSAVRVRRMIHSSVYKGVRERLVANSVILNELPFALVDPALWDAANYSIAEPSVSLRWRTRGSDPFLLGGMIYCTACADSTVNAQRRVYTGWTATRSSGKYVYYRCSGAAHHAEGGYARCPSSNIPGETLEAAVIAAVGARIRQPESTIEALREAVRARLGVAADTKGRRERIEAKLHEKERARGQIRAGLRSGALTADEVEADLKVLLKQQQELQAELHAVNASVDVTHFEEARLTATASMFDELAAQWEEAVDSDDRNTLRRIICRLVREINATPIAKGVGKRKAKMRIECVFNFDPPGEPFRSLGTYGSAYVTDGRKTPPLELTEALQIGCAMTRG